MNVDLRPDQLHTLSICSGGGGLDLGLRLAVPAARTVAYVEIEAYACSVLVSRMEAGELDAAPLCTNLKTFDGRRFAGLVDCLIGGYPCQPFSVAGRQRGTADPRHLWPYIGGQRPEDGGNLVRDLGFPSVLFFENVANHLRIGFPDVARDLRAMGYAVAAGVFTAEEVGATQKRERLFILAYAADAYRRRGERHTEEGTRTDRVGRRGSSSGSTGVVDAESVGRREGRPAAAVRSRRDSAPRAGGQVGDANDARSQRRVEPIGERADELPAWPPGPEDDEQWARVLRIRPDLAPAIEPVVRRMADGMAPRVDRLRLLGNGVVPAQAAHAFRCLAADLEGSLR